MGREYRFREAGPGDEGLLLEFMALLSEHCGHGKEMQATALQVREWVFERRHVEAFFVLDEEGGEAGFALYYFNCWPIKGKCGIYLENLLVREGQRGKGYGRAMLDRLAAICAEKGMQYMEWDCMEGDAAALAFYEKWGARQDRTFFTMSVADVPALIRGRAEDGA